MNKLKTIKYKTSSSIPTTTGNHHHHSDGSLFDKISKRYSTVRFLRKTTGRKTSSGKQQPVSGSYDMTGRESDDHKLEIGAPILISKTVIDTDTIGSRESCDSKASNNNNNSSDQSENIYMDANSSSGARNHTTTSCSSFGDLKFSFYTPETSGKETSGDFEAENVYDMPRINRHKLHDDESQNFQGIRSKSAVNLHKTELSLNLERTPSMSTVEQQQLHPHSKINPKDSDNKIATDMPFTNEYTAPTTTTTSTTTTANQRTSSNLSLNRNGLNRDRIYSYSHDSITANSSIYDENDQEDDDEDEFDLKSASFQSLEARNLFLSIEELNNITKQINESDEFKPTGEKDLEYCAHRDNLKPSERRITLLRNKNQRILNMSHRKDKLSNAWSGFKSWIGEERGKIREVVHKHAALQRVGANFNKSPLASSAATSKNNSYDCSDGACVIDVSSKENEHEPEERRNCDENNAMVSSFNANNSTNTNGVPSNGHHSDQHNNSSGNESSAPSTLNRYGSRRVVGAEDIEFNEQMNRSIDSRIKHGTDHLEGQNGFEELRRYVKQGSDFGKDLVAILQERAESEQLYAKSLSKMASKLNKACREVPGSLADAWRNVATEMESRSEVHRQFSNTMADGIVKPLKQMLDNQHKTRKAIEGTVDKSARILAEWRASEAKSKKTSHAAARENEKLQDAMLDVRIQRAPSAALTHHNPNITINNNNNLINSSNNNIHTNTNNNSNSILHLHKQSADKDVKNAEKDCAKLDNKRRKAEETVKRADVEYYTLCIRAERARVEWEMSVLRGSSLLQNQEGQRLECLKTCVATYLKLSNDMNPTLNTIVERLAPSVTACNVQKDVAVVANIRRVSEGPSEQLLPDFYCEHTTLAMNRDRRKQALIKLLQLVKTDLERERKSRNGLKGLSQSLNTQENQNITDKLYHIRSMLTYLEGARFKLQSALLELDHKPRGSHPLAAHIQITRDRTGLQQSILKVPLWLKNGDEEKISQALVNCANNYDNGSEVDAADCNDAKTNGKTFDRNYNRSKSNIDYSTMRSGVSITTGGPASTIILDSQNLESPEFDRGIADGGSNQQDSDFDEFSSQDEDDEISSSKNSIQTTRRNSVNNAPPKILGRCKALYAYSPKLDDELEINPGDIMEIHYKQEDGWWVGALKNKIGIFPATYVEEIV